MIVNIYTPVYHRYLKTKTSIESIIETVNASKNDARLYIGVNGIEGGKGSPMDEWIKCLAKNNKVSIFIGDRNYGKAFKINHMFSNSRQCDYVVSIDSDMIADENKQYNWIDELVKIMEWEPAKNFGLLSTWQKENSCHVLDNLKERTEFLGHWVKFGTFSGIAGGCVIIREKDFIALGKYEIYDIYSGDDALLMRNVWQKLNKLVGVVETVKLTHPHNDREENDYQIWKFNKCRGKLPLGLDTKGFYD